MQNWLESSLTSSKEHATMLASTLRSLIWEREYKRSLTKTLDLFWILWYDIVGEVLRAKDH
jgi:hypothetical protein